MAKTQTSPASFLNKIGFHASCLPGYLPSEGVKSYLRRGKEIPDELLPGRFIMRMKPEERKILSTLTSDDAKNVAPWWIKVMCS